MQVAAAERQTQQDVPILITGSWMLTIENSSLSGKLQKLIIQSQPPEPGSPSDNLLFGKVDGVGSVKVYDIFGGQTEVVGSSEQTRQYVLFNLIVDDKIYLFRRGQVVDGMSIEGGTIYSLPVLNNRVDFVEDGTWSAQATPGEPADDRHQHHHHKYGRR